MRAERDCGPKGERDYDVPKRCPVCSPYHVLYIKLLGAGASRSIWPAIGDCWRLLTSAPRIEGPVGREELAPGRDGMRGFKGKVAKNCQ